MEHKVLLTGGAGYIGSHTYVKLSENGFNPIIVDNFSNSKPEVVERLKRITGRDVVLYNVDCCDFDALSKVFEENKDLEAVIHFAGYKAVGESVHKPEMYYQNNIDSTLALLKCMKKYNVNNIVFSSSATVYGIPEKVPLDETMKTGCLNPYGWTKLMNEQILQDVSKANPDLSVVLLRYFNPIGAHESGLIGEDPAGIPNNLFPYICQVAVGKLKELSIFGNDYETVDGTGVRDYIHVCDLAMGHLAALNYSFDHKGCEIVNLGTGNGYSVLQMVNSFEKINGVKIPYKFVPRREGDVAECYADASKAKKDMGWEAKKNLEDMCKDAWNWQKNNPNGYDK